MWVGKNCTWYAGGNPGAGTGANADISSLSTVFPMWGSWSTWGCGNNNAVTANFGGSAFARAVPAGFNPGF